MDAITPASGDDSAHHVIPFRTYGSLGWSVGFETESRSAIKNLNKMENTCKELQARVDLLTEKSNRLGKK